MTWRVIRDGPQPGSRNMALDHALASRLSEGHGTLRFYSWSRPTASFGRHEPAAQVYSDEAAEVMGVEYVRRPTGGRAVLHDSELTYSIVADARSIGGARAAYTRINGALANALASLGAAVAISVDDMPLSPDAGPCFQAPTDGEVIAMGRKLVGSAQARVEGALLQHGSIILSGDQSLLDKLRVGSDSTTDRGGPLSAQGVPVTSTPGEPHPVTLTNVMAEQHRATRTSATGDQPPATLADLIGTVEVEVVIDAVVGAMSEEFGGSWIESGQYTQDELNEADRLESERYGTEEWTWRR